ncbi:MAG TPA: DUF3300 domain-containing protein [Bryobacteraceae bacterium]|nr:DUF3300 domain-containing protein [Bryobacteraceae bacterium]
MNIFGRAAGFSRLRLGRQSLASLLSLALLFVTMPQSLPAQDAPAPDAQAQAPPYAQQTPEQLQRLVAPIALYPDSLVAQILAASTFPEQVVEADRWVQAHPDLKGDALGHAVDQQPWDQSVKALTSFPSVLGNMDKNLAWTSSLGDAYFNQQPDVMDAIQAMRQRAQQAGNLKSTQQQTVETQGSTIVIQPAAPEVVYVPAYDPWVVYGDPILAWPGWYPYPGIWYDGPYLWWGIGFDIGWGWGFGWGWDHWGFDWHHRYATHDHNRYYSRSNTFYNRNNFYRGGNARGDGFNRAGTAARSFSGDTGAARGYAPRGNEPRENGQRDAEPRGQSGVRSGAFSGYERGGEARGFSSRGSASFGGGGFGRGGGGGFGGGGHGGGGHR